MIQRKPEMAANPQQRYTLEEYFELERRSEERFEFWNGEVFSMSGVSPEHGQIESNLIFCLRTKLSGRSCRIFPANVRIKVPTAPPYRYPDLSALCDEAQYEKIGGIDALTNPALIVEVLSPSTEAYDWGEKFWRYKSIPSFSEYLLIAQDRTFVTQFVKHSSGDWIRYDFADLSDNVKIHSLSCEMSLSEVYQDIKFAAEIEAA
jgi:Uma2 family endonuclease